MQDRVPARSARNDEYFPAAESRVKNRRRFPRGTERIFVAQQPNINGEQFRARGRRRRERELPSRESSSSSSKNGSRRALAPNYLFLLCKSNQRQYLEVSRRRNIAAEMNGARAKCSTMRHAAAHRLGESPAETFPHACTREGRRLARDPIVSGGRRE